MHRDACVGLDAPGKLAPVHRGHVLVEDGERDTARLWPLRPRASRAPPRPTQPRRSASRPLRAGRAGSRGSSRCRRPRGRADPPVARRRPRTCRGPRPWSSRSVNQNVEPTPGELVTPISPPIRCTSCRQIARPSPVPPCSRVVDASTCENGRKSFSWASDRHPDAGVSHLDAHAPSAFALAVEPRADGDFAARRELDGVADEVHEDLPHPGRISRARRVERRLGLAAQLEALVLGRKLEHRRDLFDDVPERELDAARARACRPRSWRNRGCR